MAFALKQSNLRHIWVMWGVAVAVMLTYLCFHLVIAPNTATSASITRQVTIKSQLRSADSVPAGSALVPADTQAMHDVGYVELKEHPVCQFLRSGMCNTAAGELIVAG